MKIEKAITEEVIKMLGDAIVTKLASRFASPYSSPLDKIVDKVVTEHMEDLEQIANNCLSAVVKDEQFKQLVQDQFKHKMARALVGKLEGTVDKAADKLRQDPAFRARMVLAIEALIKDDTNTPATAGSETL